MSLAMATILIIDDEKPIRALLRTALEAVGHEVMGAANGRIGLVLYRHRPADLVIADIVMSDTNGLDTLLELTREFIQVKVIAISSGRGLRYDLEVANLLGARQTIQKPLNVQLMLDAVRHELEH